MSRPPSEPMTMFGEEMEKLRGLAGLSIAEWCARLSGSGVSTNTYWRWITGRCECRYPEALTRQGYHILRMTLKERR